MNSVNIGQASKASGVSAKMIRHYEEVGLIPAANRTEAGYRQYSEADVHSLRFIRHARDLGFSIVQIGELVGLWQNRRRSSSRVKALALAHVAELERKVASLQAMKDSLQHLAMCCHGDDRPECPILDRLADDTPR
ncbi:MAG: Cu(I)-responsive transcriptional regulator [Burkholderiales bacterium]|nr:Cu(I)-responsive transcriptional regulator [Burkholderiales bacterium]